MTQSRQREQGVVSIFIVVFSAIFMTIIVASFVNVMINEQRQSTALDLSQSAYDSAMAGVEDAKRALVYCQTASTTNPGCHKIKTDPVGAASDCILLQEVGVASFTTAGDNEEVRIQKSSSSSDNNNLDQAYTCVGITTESDDVQATVDYGKVTLIPLRSTQSFDSVKISWNTAGATSQSALPPSGDRKFSTFPDWNNRIPTDNRNFPPVIQATLIKAPEGRDVDQASFNNPANATNDTGASTIVLRPSNASDITQSFGSDLRVTPNNPYNIRCQTTGGPFTPSGPYSCSATITLSQGGLTFLALQPIYKGADVNVALYNGGALSKFTGVQAVVDSTGRANDIFRRVSARVNLEPLTGAYPNAALNLSGSLCKDFTVPGPHAGYTSQGLNCD